MDSDDEAIQQFEDWFKECVALHKRSYPSSHPDFDEMNLSERLRQGLNPSVQGHFADVYKGRLDGQLVAIKLLRYSDSTYRTVVLRFVREVSTWSVLDHVNIPSLLGIVVGGGRIGLVSHWHENGTLAQFLKETENPATLDLILDVAEGTQYLHTCPTPVVHGDLKGANILISEIGIARLTDFGISKQSRDSNSKTYLTTSGGTKGTTPWMAPELEDIDASVSFASDIYSIAGVFLEICCPGKYPYHYFSRTYNILHTKMCGEPPNRSQYPEMIGRNALWQLMSACWAFDPSERPEIGEVVLTLYSQFQLLSRLSEGSALQPSSLCPPCDPTYSIMDGQFTCRAPFTRLTHAIHARGRSANGHHLFQEAPGPSIWTRHSPPRSEMEHSNSDFQTLYDMVRHVRENHRGEGHRPATRGDLGLSMTPAEVGISSSHEGQSVPAADIDTLTPPTDDPQNPGTQPNPPNTPERLNSTATAESWEAYNGARDLEEEFVTNIDSALDGLLIFAAFFSAVNMVIIVESDQRLRSHQRSLQMKRMIEALLSSIESPQDMLATPPSAASPRGIGPNASFYASLCCSLCAAFGVVLAKRWLSQYNRDVGGSFFEHFIVTLPTLLQYSLYLLLVGFVDLLVPDSEPVVSTIPYLSFNTFLYYSTTIIVFIASEGTSRAWFCFL